MAGEAAAADPAVGGVAFELDRFEWVGGERIDIAGQWVGVRGLRFVRPTLTLRGGGAEQRLLADLEHKPWTPHDDGPWVAAFAWDGALADVEEAELAVASELEVILPAPRRVGNGRRPARKKPVRYQARGALAGAEPDRVEEEPARHAEVAKPPREGAPIARRPQRTVKGPKAPKEPKAADPRVARLEEVVESLGSELTDAATERARDAGRIARLEAERDEAIATLDAARADLIAARTELDDARSELDDARSALESARRACEALEAEHDAAKAEVTTARAERAAAARERDAAERQRDTALEECASARRESATAVEERDLARRERDAAPARPGFYALTQDPATSPLALWTPRLIALGIFLLFAIVVLRLFASAF